MAIDKLRSHVVHARVACTDFDRFGNDSAIDYAYAFPALAQGGFGGALSISYQGTREPSEVGVARMRDLLVKLWIGKRSPLAPIPAEVKVPESGH